MFQAAAPGRFPAEFAPSSLQQVARTFHELLVRNVYYSPRIELLRSFERSDRRQFGASCAPGASWALLYAAGAAAPAVACDAPSLQEGLARMAGGNASTGLVVSESDLVVRHGPKHQGAVVVSALSEGVGLPDPRTEGQE